jgi:hypothetical protein
MNAKPKSAPQIRATPAYSEVPIFFTAAFFTALRHGIDAQDANQRLDIHRNLDETEYHGIRIILLRVRTLPDGPQRRGDRYVTPRAGFLQFVQRAGARQEAWS